MNTVKKKKNIVETIWQTNDSLAYFDGSAAFLVYKNSLDLNSYAMSMGRPVHFQVYNEKALTSGSF